MAKSTSSSGGTRTTKERVKTAKGRKLSSTIWLQRQLNDPYVHQAKKDGYRSRAAYKLIELDDRFRFLKPGKRVLDLGAAPGGWTQVSVERVKSTIDDTRVIAVDLLPMAQHAGAHVLKLDFMDEKAPAAIRALLPQGVDIVLSDMAPNTMGHAATDHIRIVALLEAAYDFACEIMKPGGVFIAKVFQGGTEKEQLQKMKQNFAMVKHAKPKASRAGSSEVYVVATGYKKRKASSPLEGED